MNAYERGQLECRLDHPRTRDAAILDLLDRVDVSEAELDRLRTVTAELVEALRKIDRELKVPAAEYVPAIPAAWDIIDAALAAATEPVTPRGGERS